MKPYRIYSLSSTFDLLAIQHRQTERYPFLLESVVYPQHAAAYSMLMAFPQQTLCYQGHQLVGPYAEQGSFFNSLEAWWQAEYRTIPPELALKIGPFWGGWFVFLGYELAAQLEPTLLVPKSGPLDTFPTAFATRVGGAIIVDHQKQQIIAWAEQAGDLEALIADIHTIAPLPEIAPLAVQAVVEANPQEFLSALAQVKQYIAAGDVFQVNLSRRWQIPLAKVATHRPVQPWQVYQQLRQSNPAPYAGLVHYQDQAIISSSPERLVRVQQQQIEVRPIAGTYPRLSGGGFNDQQQAQALLAHPKERAEHIMLIDLERNDLGRICQPGSIQVNELMVIETYRHVHHIVSNVRGQLRAGVSPSQVLRAVFPGGTITGCPKVRCMQIIAELEQAQRGPYTGAMGYLNQDGSLDLNILIRTLVYQPHQLWFRAGSGIVADSDPERELAETRAKAKGLLAAFY